MTMDERAKFEAERRKVIAQYGTDDAFKSLSQEWLQQSMSRRYVYNFDWLGRPIIQYPQDMVAVQELIWRVRPDVVVETGIAHGGSLILSASTFCRYFSSSTMTPSAMAKRLTLPPQNELWWALISTSGLITATRLSLTAWRRAFAW